MTDGGRLNRFLRTKLRDAGREYAEARKVFADARASASSDLPLDDAGKARIVCRRHAERRAVAVDGEGRPACFEAGHADCEGCVEDVRAGRIETW